MIKTADTFLHTRSGERRSDKSNMASSFQLSVFGKRQLWCRRCCLISYNIIEICIIVLLFLSRSDLIVVTFNNKKVIYRGAITYNSFGVINIHFICLLP